MPHDENTTHVLDGILEGLTVEDVRFRREWVFVILTILAWMKFWDMAEQHQNDWHAQILGWTAVILSVAVAYNL